MGSRVPPALTRTRRPARVPAPARRASTAAAISAGSASRPTPTSPSASSPDAGATTCTPRSASRPRLRAVAGWVHMRVFIAGAITTGPSKAR